MNGALVARGGDGLTDETRAFLRQFEEATQGVPTVLDTPIAQLRDARAQGTAALPIVRIGSAVVSSVPGPGGALEVRRLEGADPQGAYLHFHGGGFAMGAPDQQDPILDRIAREAGVTVLSAGYRLAPENPYPAALDDCEAVASWLLDEVEAGAFGGGPVIVGGDSAGAYLAMTTLLRLRSRGRRSFDGVLLNFGFFDLGLSPSARNWGECYSIVSTPILRRYVDDFLPVDVDRRSPEVSPLYADLTSLPPALFTVGTLDPLVDDSLLMAGRWRAAGNRAEIDLVPGGIHAFLAFPIAIASESIERQAMFVRRLRASRSPASEPDGARFVGEVTGAEHR